MTNRSTHVPTFQAASTPNETAMITASKSVVVASDTVGSMRWTMSLLTGSCEKMEVPKLPLSTPPNQRANCTAKGSSRPSCLRTASICTCVALSPTMIAAGSPGERCSSRKMNTATIAMTSTVESKRRMIKASIGANSQQNNDGQEKTMGGDAQQRFGSTRSTNT